MLPQEFCYWLQGHFELQIEIEKLNSKQLEIIQRHLDLVFECSKMTKQDKSTDAYGFCNWLQGFLESKELSEYTKGDASLIQDKLNNIFQHEIDLTYTKDKKQQTTMNTIHNPDSTLLRC